MAQLVRFIIIFILLLSFVGCDQPAAPLSGLKIKIGVITPISGSNSAAGKHGLKGIQFARQLNSFLDNGDEIELIIEDDQSDPKKSVIALDKLVNENHVSAILLLSGSNSAVAVSKVANKYETPIIATIATNPEAPRNSQFISQLAFDDETQAIVAALFVRDELLIKRVAIFNNPNSIYSNYLAQKFADKLKSVDGIVTDFINLSEEGPNNYLDIIKMVQKKDPKLLYLPINANAVLAIAKAAKEINWSPKMLATDGMLSRVIEQNKSDLKLLNGMLATDLYSSTMILSDYGKKVLDHINENNIKITTHLLTGIEGYDFLLNAINQCEEPISRLCINDMMHTQKDFTGITGIITINENGKTERTLFVNTIEGEQLKSVVKVH
ncbi:MAG: ABC transporter substrate-binding protein [Thiohalomonadales bacterium]